MSAMQSEPWHLDKRVPLALIITIFLQTAGIVWWAAGIAMRVEQHAVQITALTARDSLHEADARRIAEYLARLDERMAALNATLHRLDARLGSAERPRAP